MKIARINFKIWEVYVGRVTAVRIDKKKMKLTDYRNIPDFRPMKS